MILSEAAVGVLEAELLLLILRSRKLNIALLTAAYVIKASEDAWIPVPHDLCLLDNHSCSWLGSHHLRHIKAESLKSLWIPIREYRVKNARFLVCFSKFLYSVHCVTLLTIHYLALWGIQSCMLLNISSSFLMDLLLFAKRYSEATE